MIGLGTLTALPADVLGRVAVLPQVAEATGVLPPMYEKMSGIESAMPTPGGGPAAARRPSGDHDELQERPGGLTEMLQRLLPSLNTLDANVAALRDAVEPIGRIADRIPGRR